MNPVGPVLPPEDQIEEPAGLGLAIASIVCGLMGPFALVGMVLGFMAILKGIEPRKGGALWIAFTGTMISGCMFTASVCYAMVALAAKVKP